MSKIEFATKRLLGAVWTVAYRQSEEVFNGVEILAYSRDIDLGYEKEDELPRMNFVENDDRTVVQLIVDPQAFALDEHRARPTALRFKVVNPKHVFEYGDEF